MLRSGILPGILVLCMAFPAAADEPDSRPARPGSDTRALEIAEATVRAMGGWDAWEATRYLEWTFFGRRHHWWDRWTGDIRIESGKSLVLMNVGSMKGRVWRDGVEIADPDTLAAALIEGHEQWVNDSYWLIMPFKLLDPGVHLKDGGEKAMEDGRPADVLVLTFDEGVGYTPRNKYDVYVARDTGLVGQWSYYDEASDPEPRFTLPWKGWTRVGRVLIATDHGRGDPWPVAAPEALPAAVFASPDPVMP